MAGTHAAPGKASAGAVRHNVLRRPAVAGSFGGLRRRPARAEHDRADAFRRVARSMLQDAVTAEVVSALDLRGIRSIVLKGPSIARLLYCDGRERSYLDS